VGGNRGEEEREVGCETDPDGRERSRRRSSGEGMREGCMLREGAGGRPDGWREGEEEGWSRRGGKVEEVEGRRREGEGGVVELDSFTA